MSSDLPSSSILEMVGVTTIISRPATRPFPSARGISFWEITPRSDTERRSHSMGRSCGANMLEMRSRVSAALEV